MGIMRLRDAAIIDGEFLFRLRRERTVARQSVSPPPRRLDVHLRWLESRLSSPVCRVFVVEEVSGPRGKRGTVDKIGMGRLDVMLPFGGYVELSLALVPAARGKGIGYEVVRQLMLRATIDYPKLPMRARIRKENTASLITFLRAGFTVLAMADGIITVG